MNPTPSSSCERLDTLLARTPEAGQALPVLESSLAAHAAQCPRCQTALARSEALLRGLSELHADFTPDTHLAARVLARSKERAPTPGRRPLILAAFAGAALASTLAVIAWFALRDSDAPTSPDHTDQLAAPAPDSPAPGSPTKNTADFRLTVTHCEGAGHGTAPESPCTRSERLTTGVGERVTYRLSDGTRLTLDQQSELVLGEEGRALRVTRGLARFDVVKRPDLPPLAVTLPNGGVQVLGTELVVRAGESLSVVEVLRGLVAVDQGDKRARVKAGEAAWLVPGRGPVVRAASVPQHDDDGERVSSDLGFGTLRARRPGGKTDAERPLRLTDHQVKVRLQGAFSHTTVEEAFASDEPHELEGIYRFTLPPGAQVAELSLLVDGRWEEGAFVERERAEKIWAGVIRNATPIIKRREVVEYIWVPGPWKDPALLSWSAGNTFELRIFPIPARGERRVRIAYTETLPLVSGARRYTLPLPSDGSNIRAERFSLDLAIGGSVLRKDVRIANYALVEEDEATLRYTKTINNFKPVGDLLVEVPEPESMGDVTAVGWARGEGPAREGYLAFGLRPSLAELQSDEGPLDLVVLVDTSYGIQRARLNRAAELVAHLFESLGSEDRAQVLACATTCRPLGGFDLVSAERGKELSERLTKVDPLGSTRLVAAFREASALLAERGTPETRRRIIYIGDGVQSVGELDGRRVGETIRELTGETRVTVVSLGGETDPVALTAMASGPAGSVLDATRIGSVRATAGLAARRQRGLPLKDVTLELPSGLFAVAPEALGELWPGDERFVTARVDGLPALDGELTLRGTLGGERVERRWRILASLEERAGHAFVPRLWAERRIADLSGRDDADSRREVIALSAAHHLLSRHTALLVLESPAMARAFDVAPTRPVADWNGDGELETQTSALLDAVGGLAHKADDAFGSLSTADADLANEASGALSGDEYKPTETRADALEKAGQGRAAGIAVPSQAPARPTEPIDRFARRGPPSVTGGEWVPMRKVWYKEASIAAGSRETDTWAERQLERRERSLDEAPDSRERTLTVIRTLVRLRHLERATRLTERWLERDRMDPEALITLADLALLSGNLERAENLITSAIDADPRSSVLHARLSRVYAETDRADLACEHRRSRALTARTDPAAQADALRCAGPTEGERLRLGLDAELLRKIDRLLDSPAPQTRVTGPFRLEATFEGGDVDLAVVDPDGRVVSWLGGAELQAGGVVGSDRESLTFKGRQNGRWQILAVRRPDPDSDRPDAHDGPDGAVHGTLRVTAHGASRRIPFTIGAEEAIGFIAEIDVQAKFRYERL